MITIDQRTAFRYILDGLVKDSPDLVETNKDGEYKATVRTVLTEQDKNGEWGIEFRVVFGVEE